MRPPRIGFLLPTYSTPSRSHMPVVLRVLAEWGTVVEVIHPSAHALALASVRVEHDLYVLKRMNGLALSLAGALHAQGAAIIHPYPVTVALADKIIASRVLTAAGIPMPATYVAARREMLAPLLEDGPLVVKPYQGSGGYGVRVVRTAAELAQLPERKEPILAQRHHPPHGPDRKLYRIGDEIYGVAKEFPRRTEAEKHGRPFTPTDEQRDLVRRCAAAFGIDLCGVDVIESEGKPYVVDMSGMPGFKGVPDAPQALARYFQAAARRSAAGQPVSTPAVPMRAAVEADVT